MGLDHLIVDNGPDVEPLLVSADKNNKVRISCPQCGHVRIVDAEKFRDTRKLLRVKCVCGVTFPCRLSREGRESEGDEGVFTGLPGRQPTDLEEVTCSTAGDGPVRVECPYCESTRYVARERFQLGNRTLVVQCGCQKSFVLRMEDPADTVREEPPPPAAPASRPSERAKRAGKTGTQPAFELPEVMADVVKSLSKATPKPRSMPKEPAREEAGESAAREVEDAAQPKPGRADRSQRKESGQWAIGNAEPGAGDRNDLRRFYADKQGNLHISCPICEYVKSVPVSGMSKIVQPARVHCVCGSVFHCFLEFRRTYRKEVSLPGEYMCLRDKDEGSMIVQDLSLEGIGFRTMGPHTMELDDVVEVRFELDDRSRSKIRRQVRVRSVRGRFIVGAMFANLHFRDKALGFYLMP